MNDFLAPLIRQEISSSEEIQFFTLGQVFFRSGRGHIAQQTCWLMVCNDKAEMNRPYYLIPILPLSQQHEMRQAQLSYIQSRHSKFVEPNNLQFQAENLCLEAPISLANFLHMMPELAPQMLPSEMAEKINTSVRLLLRAKRKICVEHSTSHIPKYFLAETSEQHPLLLVLQNDDCECQLSVFWPKVSEDQRGWRINYCSLGSVIKNWVQLSNTKAAKLLRGLSDESQSMLGVQQDDLLKALPSRISPEQVLADSAIVLSKTEVCLPESLQQIWIAPTLTNLYKNRTGVSYDLLAGWKLNPSSGAVKARFGEYYASHIPQCDYTGIIRKRKTAADSQASA